ncbi:MAG: hypothetical protein LBN95_03825 [Prevotellaceae bacterium]|jgi:hypothetical protein|nr:hypothetical protein [Prevotellaceae bacterium]
MKQNNLIYELDDVGFVGMQLSESERNKSREVFRAYIQAHKAQQKAETAASKQFSFLRKIAAL